MTAASGKYPLWTALKGLCTTKLGLTRPLEAVSPIHRHYNYY
jgi:hypothetical protein